MQVKWNYKWKGGITKEQFKMNEMKQTNIYLHIIIAFSSLHFIHLFSPPLLFFPIQRHSF